MYVLADVELESVAKVLQTAGQLYYGPVVASDYPGLIGSEQHTKYDVLISDGMTGFPLGTRILSTQSLGHNGTEELAMWRSIDAVNEDSACGY